MNADPMQACFHEVAGELPAGTRRAILLSYHFPPGQAAGALRWQKFVELGAEHGWVFDVVTLDPRCIERGDAKRLAALPCGTRVFGVADEPLLIERLEDALWRLTRKLRSRPSASASTSAAPASPAAPARSGSLAREEVRFRIGEPRSWWRAYQALLDVARQARWARGAAKLAVAIADAARHDAVVSSGPPEMAHEGARRVAARTGLPLVIDFRDPWSLRERLPEHLASPAWYASARRYEVRAVERASWVVMNTDAALDAMGAVYPAARARMSAIPNGYDDDPLPQVSPARRFVLAYAGAIYLDRSPEVLFAAAARMLKARGVSADDFTIEFMGYVDPLLRIEERAREAGIEDCVRVHAAGTREEAAAFLGRATMLLNLPQDSHMAIPSKIYEYMRYASHLLVLAEPSSATACILRGTEADVVAPDDEDTIAEVLAARFESWRRGDAPEPIARYEAFSRRSRAAAFFEVLDRVAGPASDRLDDDEVH